MTNNDCELQADKVRIEYNPQNLAPFPYENVTSKNTDLEVVLVNFKDDEVLKDISGAISRDDDDNVFRVYINSDKPKTRQNFTIAHELGHYFLHKSILEEHKIIVDDDNYVENKRVLYRLDSQERNKIETEANIFAANLLMPKDLVAEAWHRIGDVKECANIFAVSQLAMTIRLTKLGFLKDE